MIKEKRLGPLPRASNGKDPSEPSHWEREEEEAQPEETENVGSLIALRRQKTCLSWGTDVKSLPQETKSVKTVSLYFTKMQSCEFFR